MGAHYEDRAPVQDLIIAAQPTMNGAPRGFVMTGSDDTNLRVWKSQSHKQLKQLLPREEDAFNYREKLKKSYEHVPEVRRLLKHRHLPRFLLKEQKKRQIMKESKYRKEQNRMAHTRPENIKKVPAQRAVVVDNQE